MAAKLLLLVAACAFAPGRATEQSSRWQSLMKAWHTVQPPAPDAENALEEAVWFCRKGVYAPLGAKYSRVWDLLDLGLCHPAPGYSALALWVGNYYGTGENSVSELYYAKAPSGNINRNFMRSVQTFP